MSTDPSATPVSLLSAEASRAVEERFPELLKSLEEAPFFDAASLRLVLEGAGRHEVLALVDRVRAMASDLHRLEPSVARSVAEAFDESFKVDYRRHRRRAVLWAIDEVFGEEGGVPMVEQWNLALLQAGGYPWLPGRETQALHEDQKPGFEGAIKQSLLEDDSHVFSRLMDWAGSRAWLEGDACLEKLLDRTRPPRTRPPGTPWELWRGEVWLVANAGPRVASAWVGHAASSGPHGTDALARPLLGYASTDSKCAAMLAAGVDPLGVDRPWEDRKAAWGALWEMWEEGLSSRLAEEIFDLQAVSPYVKVEYWKKSLSLWTRAERREALAPQLLSLYIDNRLAGHKATEGKRPLPETLLRWLGCDPSDRIRSLKENGVTWTFSAAMAKRFLVGRGPAWMAMPGNLSRHAADTEVWPGVTDRDVARFSDLMVDVPRLSKPGSGWEGALPASWLVLMEHLIKEVGQPPGSCDLPVMVFRNLLKSSEPSVVEGVRRLADPFLEAVLSTQVKTATTLASTLMVWIRKNDRQLTVVERARWGVVALSWIDHPGIWAESVSAWVVEALNQGWDERSSGSAVLRESLKRIRTTQPALQRILEAGAHRRMLEGSLDGSQALDAAACATEWPDAKSSRPRL